MSWAGPGPQPTKIIQIATRDGANPIMMINDRYQQWLNIAIQC